MNDQSVSTEIVRDLILLPTGEFVLVGATKETATTTTDGSIQYEKTSVRITTIDGTTIQSGDAVHVCATCHTGPYSTSAMSNCAVCARNNCKTCTTSVQGVPVCNQCNDAMIRSARRAYRWSIND